MRQRLDAVIDFAGVESGRLKSKTVVDDRKPFQRFAEQPVIAGGDFGQAIIGDRKGLALGAGKMVETNRGDFGMPGHDIEPKTLNAAGDLTDLPLVVDAGWLSSAVRELAAKADCRLALADASLKQRCRDS